MNPPPLPPPLPEANNPWPRRLAWIGIIAPLLVVIIAVVAGLSAQGQNSAVEAGHTASTIGIPLVLSGLICAIAALCGIPKQGTRGLLGPGLIGLALNLGLVIFVFFAVSFAMSRQRQAKQELQASTQKLQDNLRNSYDPHLGITNAQGNQLKELSSQFQQASEKLRGDDAAMMKAAATFLGDMQPSLTRYENALQALREANSLPAASLTNRIQLVERRKIIQTFLDANAAAREMVLNSEKRLRAEFAKVTSDTAKIDAAMQGYRIKAVPRNKLAVQIRDCDERMGNAMLGTLAILENEWGNWHTRGNQIEFQHTLISEEYNGFLREMSAASSEQISLQGELVKMGQ